MTVPLAFNADLPILLGGIGTVVISLLFWGVNRRGWTRRRHKFLEREALTEDAWFASYFPVADIARAELSPLLRSLGEEIGVTWTQLRPTDSFAQDLRVDRRYGPQEDLDDFDEEVVQWLRRHRTNLDGVPLPKTLGELLNQLHSSTR